MVAIKAETLNLGQELGQGEFGSVLRGTYRAPDGKLVSTLYIGNPAPRSSTCPVFNFALCKCGGGEGKVFDTSHDSCYMYCMSTEGEPLSLGNPLISHYITSIFKSA